MDFSGRVQQKDFEIQDPWVPVTPAKPIPTKKPPISGSNWLEPADVSATRTGSSGGSRGLANHSQAAALASAGRQVHALGHNDGSRTLVFNSTEGWMQMPYRSFLAITDAAVPSKMTTLAPFMLAQIGGSSSQESQNQNQLLLNGKVLLTSSVCNSNNRLAAAAAHRSQYGFPIPFLPNLNSLPENTSMVASEAMPSPSTPAALEKNERIQDCPPLEIIDLVDERAAYRNIQGNEFGTSQPIAEKPVELCLSNPVVSSQIVSSLLQEGEMNVVVSSEEPLEIEKHAERENQGIDLNKTPQQKPKRKKHRPKVIREGKPVKTPKPVTPKPARKTENPSGKRKYVRKKKDLNSQETPSSALGELVNPESGSGTKSVRRSLNFELDDSQPRNGCLGSKTQAREACSAAATAIASSSTNSAVHSAKGRGTVLLDSLAFDLNSSTNQFANENVRIPETPNPPPQPSRRELMRLNLIQDEYIRMLNNPTPPPETCRRERENLKELARKNDCFNIAGNHERSMEAGQNQVDSNKVSDLLLKGTKRDHSLVDDAQVSGNISFMRAYNGTGRVSESHNVSRHGPCSPEIHKRKRTDNGQNELTSNASSTPSSGWKTIQVMQNTSEVFTFADAQRLMALEKMGASERMMVFDQVERTINNGSVQARSPTSPSAAMDCHKVPTPVKLSGYNNMSCNQPSTPEKPYGCNDNSQENEICGPQARREEVKPKTRRSRKERVHLVNSISSNTNQIENEAGSCNPGSSPVCITPSALKNAKEKNAHLRISSIQDCQSSNNHKGSVCANIQSRPVVPYEDLVDNIVHKLRHLNINGGHEDVIDQVQNALVPYGGGGGVMVPFEGPFNLTKKRRPRAKVDLDPESNRVWKLLMGKESSEGDGEIEMDKEKWWEEERRVFCGRAESFIARMHLVQGDRRFSQWKGSVVDSVIGVFLTQNVSDHLSSSAFMALAARFPLRPRGNNMPPNAEKIIKPIEQQDECIIAFDDTIRWQGKMSDQELSDQSPLPIHETEYMDDKEMANSNESVESNSGGSIVDYSKGKSLDFHERELGIGHESPDSGSGPAVTVTSSTSVGCVAEAEDRRSLEDVVSSQNSVVSSQNSSECLVQVVDQSRLSSLLNFEADDLLTGGMGNGFNSFTELLKMANGRALQELNCLGNERISSTEYGGGIDQLEHLGIDKRPSVPNQSDYLNGAGSSIYTSNSHLHPTHHDFTSLSCAPSPSYYFQSSSNSVLVGMDNANVVRDESKRSHLPQAAFEINKTNKIEIMGRQHGPSAENLTKAMDPHKLLLASKIGPPADSYAPTSKHSVQPVTSSGTEVHTEKHCCCQSNLPKERTEALSNKSISSRLQDGHTAVLHQREREAVFQVKSTQHAVEAQAQIQHCRTPQTYSNSQNNNQRNTLEVVEAVESNLINKVSTSQKVSAETLNNASKAKKVKAETEKKKTFDWDTLRKQACCNGSKKERSSDTMDSLDYEAIRCADVSEISHTIRERGMNNMLAERIKEFLNRLVRDHGSIDLEWLRDVPPDKAKDYLLSIRGLGLKSVECVRLLTLHHLAFPVDTNVGRICVRLGWVPLQPLPESLQLHLLEMYPVLETIQKYLWPRLCKLDQRTLYELHYQMITFGKVFCTKSKPNCNACPMRGECKHFASAFASARLALPGPEEKGLVTSTIPIASERGHAPVFKPMPLPQLEGSTLSQDRAVPGNCEPIIEEPATPEPECIETSESAIEDAFYDDPDEIPTIKLNLEEFTQNLQNYMQENYMELQDGDMSKALVAITPEAASIPMPKLKNVSRLRTEHQVYELPDSHPLVEGLDQREPDDPCPYLLAIWTPGETAQSTEPPTVCCDSHDMGKLCDKNTCFSCNSIREAQTQMVRGTLLIPCRTAMRGSFPLNGTYFQVNEVFADHDSSRNPIDVPRDWIWSLPRRTVYFGTSIPTIFKGLTTEGIQHCFWRGFVCVRGFDRTTRAPRPLYARLHFPASKAPRNKKTAAAAAAKKEE